MSGVSESETLKLICKELKDISDQIKSAKNAAKIRYNSAHAQSSTFGNRSYISQKFKLYGNDPLFQNSRPFPRGNSHVYRPRSAFIYDRNNMQYNKFSKPATSSQLTSLNSIQSKSGSCPTNNSNLNTCSKITIASNQVVNPEVKVELLESELKISKSSNCVLRSNKLRPNESDNSSIHKDLKLSNTELLKSDQHALLNTTILNGTKTTKEQSENISDITNISREFSQILKVGSPSKSVANEISQLTNKVLPSQARRLVKTTFKVVNKNSPLGVKNKLLANNDQKLKSPSSMKKVVNTKYKIVNKKKSIILRSPLSKNLLDEIQKSSTINNDDRTLVQTPKRTVYISTNLSQRKKTARKHSSVTPDTFKKKLKLVKREQNGELDLTHLTPEELVSLDHKSMLKLSALVTSNAKKDSFVKKNKYKIVSKPTSIRKKNPLSNKTVNNKNMHRLNFSHTNYQVKKLKINKTGRKDKCKTIITIRGSQFEKDSCGKTLKKLSDKKSAETLKTTNAESQASSEESLRTPNVQIQNIASRVLNRSIQRAVAKSKKTNNTVYCMFYNRFGRCNRQANCPYIHDPSKIAVCTRFLRGTCKEEKCPFSHERNPGKMAICSFFLQGSCTTKDCPYRHEMLKPDAQLCQDFVKGYCALADKCPKAHILVCPQYFQGNCAKGSSCSYPHPVRKEKKIEVEEDIPISTTTSEDKPSGDSPATDNDDLRYYQCQDLPITKASCEDAASKVGKPSYVWKNETDVPVLPKYIPLSFEDSECLMD